MTKRIKIVLSILAGIFLVCTELALVYLFPNFDLEGTSSIFMLLVFLPIPVGILTYSILNSSKQSHKLLIISLIIISSVILQITFHPVAYSDRYFSNNSWGRIFEYFNAYFHYPDNVEYEDLAYGNVAQRIAASVKYKDSLPDTTSMLTIHKRIGTNELGNGIFDWENIERRFYFEKREGEIIYDTDQLVFEQRENGLWLIFDPNSSNPTEHFFTAREFRIESVFSNSGWYYGDYFYNFSAHTFIPDNGAGKLLYKLLSLK